MAKGNPKEMPHKSNSNYPEGVTQRRTLSLPVCLSTSPVFFFLLLNPLFASLFSLFGAILLCKAKEPGPLSLTTCLVVRIWCSHLCNLDSVSGEELKPHFKRLQAKATQDHCVCPMCSTLWKISLVWCICSIMSDSL